MLAGEGHIPLACTPDTGSAAPISGVLDACNTEFRYEMKVQRILETPRVTRPYSDEQWRDIAVLGQKVEADLRAGDVRLTMGGEPTFVSVENPDSAEWNTSALGPQKRKLSVAFFLKLRDRFTSGALLHFGQGKWYPGELLPRWALGCYWRKDRVAIWENPGLVADENKDYGYTTEDARLFFKALTLRLQVNSSFVSPAYEDVFYYLWKERRLPGNVDPLDSRVKDPTERAQIARVFEQGLGAAVGYFLPLRRIPTVTGTPRWTSQPWFVRSDHRVPDARRLADGISSPPRFASLDEA